MGKRLVTQFGLSPALFLGLEFDIMNTGCFVFIVHQTSLMMHTATCCVASYYQLFDIYGL